MEDYLFELMVEKLEKMELETISINFSTGIRDSSIKFLKKMIRFKSVKKLKALSI